MQKSELIEAMVEARRGTEYEITAHEAEQAHARLLEVAGAVVLALKAYAEWADINAQYFDNRLPAVEIAFDEDQEPLAQSIVDQSGSLHVRLHPAINVGYPDDQISPKLRAGLLHEAAHLMASAEGEALSHDGRRFRDHVVRVSRLLGIRVPADELEAARWPALA